MTSDDDYAFEGAAPQPARDNNPPLSISELSFALKRTLEERFGHVRLRGEISKVNRHASGHVYLTLKDDKSAIDGVIWKGVVRGLGVQPETGLEVILWDERRTTIDAHNILFQNGQNAKKRKKTVDAVAAALMLEGYLTRRRLEGAK